MTNVLSHSSLIEYNHIHSYCFPFHIKNRGKLILLICFPRLYEYSILLRYHIYKKKEILSDLFFYSNYEILYTSFHKIIYSYIYYFIIYSSPLA